MGSNRLEGIRTGLNGFYWVLLGFTGFYWVLPGFRSSAAVDRTRDRLERDAKEAAVRFRRWFFLSNGFFGRVFVVRWFLGRRTTWLVAADSSGTTKLTG